jgi:hypothetical protein
MTIYYPGPGTIHTLSIYYSGTVRKEPNKNSPAYPGVLKSSSQAVTITTKYPWERQEPTAANPAYSRVLISSQQIGVNPAIQPLKFLMWVPNASHLPVLSCPCSK